MRHLGPSGFDDLFSGLLFSYFFWGGENEFHLLLLLLLFIES